MKLKVICGVSFFVVCMLLAFAASNVLVKIWPRAWLQGSQALYWVFAAIASLALTEWVIGRTFIKTRHWLMMVKKRGENITLAGVIEPGREICLFLPPVFGNQLIGIPTQVIIRSFTCTTMTRRVDYQVVMNGPDPTDPKALLALARIVFHDCFLEPTPALVPIVERALSNYVNEDLYELLETQPLDNIENFLVQVIFNKRVQASLGRIVSLKEYGLTFQSANLLSSSPTTVPQPLSVAV